MKYALLIYSNDTEWENLSDDEKSAIYGEYAAVSETAGVVGGQELQPADTATTVRVNNGSTLTTDGPFAETKEALGGAGQRGRDAATPVCRQNEHVLQFRRVAQGQMRVADRLVPLPRDQVEAPVAPRQP